jgi:Serine carboxypeptidase S28
MVRKQKTKKIKKSQRMMKRFVVLLLLTTVIVAVQSQIPAPATSWFNQRLDHYSFTLSDEVTWRQRYLYTTAYLNSSKPLNAIVFYTGNEGDIEMFYENTGFAFVLAARYNSLVVFGEHRFYGQSWPHNVDTGRRIESVRTLSMEQALADYAHMVDSLKRDSMQLFGVDASTWPAFCLGGSYGHVDSFAKYDCHYSTNCFFILFLIIIVACWLMDCVPSFRMLLSARLHRVHRF